jgi:hypothetical protein
VSPDSPLPAVLAFFRDNKETFVTIIHASAVLISFPHGSQNGNRRGDDLSLENSTVKETSVSSLAEMSPLIEIGLVVAAYVVGRVQQFVRDAKAAMGGKK